MSKIEAYNQMKQIAAELRTYIRCADTHGESWFNLRVTGHSRSIQRSVQVEFHVPPMSDEAAEFIVRALSKVAWESVAKAAEEAERWTEDARKQAESEALEVLKMARKDKE